MDTLKLSVIIVNYNVRYFLEQCLTSVEEAIKTYENNSSGNKIDVYVVDNNSHDTSCEMVKQNFPKIKLIENKTNPGFSGGNNQAMRISKAEYFLLLNPDTVVSEDTFLKCIKFMDKNLKAGGLGVKMIDGNGNFLPESKRALPTPAIAFYKIFGLSALFPKSKTFGKYHLKYLDDNQNHEIEILSGAFMFMRKKVLDKIGLLDEDFFMYGEDIDLSYRILKGGYKNYYFHETKIIHYKGESTKTASLKYVYIFYNAMIIFAKKHFSSKKAGIYILLIKLAIVLRASVAAISRFFIKLKNIFPKNEKEKNLLIIDKGNSSKKIEKHFKSSFKHIFKENVKFDNQTLNIKTYTKLTDLMKKNRINEVFYMSNELSFTEIIEIMILFSENKFEVGIVSKNSKILIKSNKIEDINV